MPKKELIALALAGALSACSSGASAPALPGGSAQSHAIVPQSAGTGYTVLTPFRIRNNATGHVISVMPTRGALGSNAPSPQGLLSYGGGPVQVHPKLYIVFWGKQWKQRGGDPDGVAKVVEGFTKAIGDSKYYKTLEQYYQVKNGKQQDISDPQFPNHVWYDTSAVPTNLQIEDSRLGEEAAKAAKHFGDTSVDASYVIATPHGVPQNGFGTQWCAWHWNDTSNTPYTDLPYMPDVGGNCGEGIVNSPGTDDGVSIVEGHEQAETETDPNPFSGWNGGDGEIGDICAWQDLENNPNAGNYPTQPLYSNAAGACVQYTN